MKLSFYRFLAIAHLISQNLRSADVVPADLPQRRQKTSTADVVPAVHPSSQNLRSADVVPADLPQRRKKTSTADVVPAVPPSSQNLRPVGAPQPATPTF